MAKRMTLAILLALATVSFAVAQTPASTAPPEGAAIVKSTQVTGTVISSDANRLTVKGDNGQQMIFIVNEKTAEPRIFHAGDRVTAEYVTLAGVGPVVSRVVYVTVPSATTTTTTYAPPAETKVTTTVVEPVPAPAPVPVPAPAPARTTLTTTTTTPAPATATTYEETSVSTLPDTASSMPLVALLGLIALGGAVAIRRFRP